MFVPIALIEKLHVPVVAEADDWIGIIIMLAFILFAVVGPVIKSIKEKMEEAQSTAEYREYRRERRRRRRADGFEVLENIAPPEEWGRDARRPRDVPRAVAVSPIAVEPVDRDVFDDFAPAFEKIQPAFEKQQPAFEKQQPAFEQPRLKHRRELSDDDDIADRGAVGEEGHVASVGSLEDDLSIDPDVLPRFDDPKSVARGILTAELLGRPVALRKGRMPIERGF